MASHPHSFAPQRDTNDDNDTSPLEQQQQQQRKKPPPPPLLLPPETTASTATATSILLTVQDVVQMKPYESEIETKILQNIIETTGTGNYHHHHHSPKSSMPSSPTASTTSNRHRHPNQTNHQLFACIPDESLPYYIGPRRQHTATTTTSQRPPPPPPPQHPNDPESQNHHHQYFMKPDTIQRRVRSDNHVTHTTRSTNTSHNETTNDSKTTTTPLRSNRTTTTVGGGGRGIPPPYRMVDHTVHRRRPPPAPQTLPPLPMIGSGGTRSSTMSNINHNYHHQNHPYPYNHPTTTTTASSTSQQQPPPQHRYNHENHHHERRHSYATVIKSNTLASMAQQLDAFQTTNTTSTTDNTINDISNNKRNDHKWYAGTSPSSPSSSSLSFVSQTSTSQPHHHHHHYRPSWITNDEPTSTIPSAVEMTTIVPNATTKRFARGTPMGVGQRHHHPPMIPMKSVVTAVTSAVAAQRGIKNSHRPISPLANKVDYNNHIRTNERTRRGWNSLNDDNDEDDDADADDALVSLLSASNEMNSNDGINHTNDDDGMKNVTGNGSVSVCITGVGGNNDAIVRTSSNKSQQQHVIHDDNTEQVPWMGNTTTSISDVWIQQPPTSQRSKQPQTNSTDDDDANGDDMVVSLRNDKASSLDDDDDFNRRDIERMGTNMHASISNIWIQQKSHQFKESTNIDDDIYGDDIVVLVRKDIASIDNEDNNIDLEGMGKKTDAFISDNWIQQQPPQRSKRSTNTDNDDYGDDLVALVRKDKASIDDEDNHERIYNTNASISDVWIQQLQPQRSTQPTNTDDDDYGDDMVVLVRKDRASIHSTDRNKTIERSGTTSSTTGTGTVHMLSSDHTTTTVLSNAAGRSSTSGSFVVDNGPQPSSLPSHRGAPQQQPEEPPVEQQKSTSWMYATWIERCCQLHPIRSMQQQPNSLLSIISFRDLWYDFEIFLRQRQAIFLLYVRYFLLIVIPAIIVAFILFYIAGNPPTGKADWNLSDNGIIVQENGDIIRPNQASISWWLLFIFVRQALTFSLAHIMQVIIVDFWCLNTQFFVNAFGRLLSLFLTSWKGWPLIAFLWGILDFIFLYGETKFASHWLYWQRIFYMFTDVNPSGEVTFNVWYTRILSVAVTVGLIVGIKRLWLGFYLGRKTYANHYEDLFKVYKKILILCAVGELSRQGLSSSRRALLSAPYSPYGINKNDLDDILQHDDNTDAMSLQENVMGDKSIYDDFILDPKNNDPDDGSLNHAEKSKMEELFEGWEEYVAEGTTNDDDDADDGASVRNVLEFRNALAKLDKPYMLGIAWGDVSTRQKMVLNSQSVYWKLKRMSTGANDGLQFDVIAELCEQPDGTLHPDELKNLIHLLRPDRVGVLSVAEFVKSVDSVYKEAKLIHASVKNSEKIDREFEKALNIPFYTIVLCIILSQIGLNPLALFISLSPLILGFSWMIGSASSKMFEGWLFILIRRPYNIGDRIHIGNVENETNWDGSASWIVQDVTLFHTVAVFGMTGERASMSNGSLASSRILNMARSPNAIIYVYVKFSTTVSYRTIQMFERILREFVQARPREWANFAGFRAMRVVADQGYIEYVVNLIHRESWQSALSIYESKAQVTSFCLELSKKLDMRYENPALPVELSIAATADSKNCRSLRSAIDNVIHGNNCIFDQDNSSNDDDDEKNDDNMTVSTSKSIESSVKESDMYNELMTMYNIAGDVGQKHH